MSIADNVVRMASPRNGLFLLLVVVSLVVFWKPLAALLHYSLLQDIQYDKYSYTLAIPFISMALVFSEKRTICTSVQYCFRTGAILLLTGSY